MKPLQRSFAAAGLALLASLNQASAGAAVFDDEMRFAIELTEQEGHFYFHDEAIGIKCNIESIVANEIVENTFRDCVNMAGFKIEDLSPRIPIGPDYTYSIEKDFAESVVIERGVQQYTEMRAGLNVVELKREWDFLNDQVCLAQNIYYAELDIISSAYIGCFDIPENGYAQRIEAMISVY